MAQTGTYITASEHRPTEYQAGYMAAVLGEAFISNPHRRGTEQRKAWALGWVEASHA